MKCLAVLTAFAGSAAAAVLLDRREPLPQLGSRLIEGITRIADAAVPAGNDTTLRKRANFINDCNDQQQRLIQSALQGCFEKARGAAQEARSGTSRLMRDFFKNDDARTRQIVSDLFSKVAEECSANNQGSTFITCVDNGGECGIFDAWTQIGGSRVLLCEKFFHNDPNYRSCGGLDNGALMLHEMTHALGATEDFQSYGLQKVGLLSAQENIRHADTYGLFANAVALSCSNQDLQTGGPPSGTRRPPPNDEIGGLEPPPPPPPTLNGAPTNTFQHGNKEQGDDNGQRQQTSFLDQFLEDIAGWM